MGCSVNGCPYILGLFSSPFFVVSKSTHFRTKEGANIMKRYGYHRISTRESQIMLQK